MSEPLSAYSRHWRKFIKWICREGFYYPAVKIHKRMDQHDFHCLVNCAVKYTRGPDGKDGKSMVSGYFRIPPEDQSKWLYGASHDFGIPNFHHRNTYRNDFERILDKQTRCSTIDLHKAQENAVRHKAIRHELELGLRMLYASKRQALAQIKFAHLIHQEGFEMELQDLKSPKETWRSYLEAQKTEAGFAQKIRLFDAVRDFAIHTQIHNLLRITTARSNPRSRHYTPQPTNKTTNETRYCLRK